MSQGVHTRIPPMPHEDQAIPPELGLRCCWCGYDLTGLPVRRCPECGEPFNPRETWLANEQSTWQYHFENVRPVSTYVAYAILAVLIAIYVLLLFTSYFGRFAIMLVIVGETLIWRADLRAYPVRLTYLLAGIIWMLAMWLANPLG